MGEELKSTPFKFEMLVEEMKNKDVTYLEIISLLCEQLDIDEKDINVYLSQNLKAKIEGEIQELHLLKGEPPAFLMFLE